MMRDANALIAKYDAASVEEKHNLQYDLVQLAVSKTAEMKVRLNVFNSILNR